MDIQAAIYARLRADSELVSALDSYGSNAALFSVPVPHDLVITEQPALYVGTPEGGPDEDTASEEYRVFDVNVRLYQKPDPANGGTAALKTASERARRVLKDWPRSDIPGGVVISATVTGPVAAPTDDPSLAGRLLLIRILTQET